MAMWNLDTSCEFVAGFAKLFGGEVFYVRYVNWVQNTTPTTKARDLG